jgi:hypothetical protein
MGNSKKVITDLSGKNILTINISKDIFGNEVRKIDTEMDSQTAGKILKLSGEL